MQHGGYDHYRINDLSLKVPSKSIYGDNIVDVFLYKGAIVGMPDFHHRVDEANFPNDLLLIWNRLRVYYEVTVDRDGLQEKGSSYVDVGRLYMIVLLEKPKTKNPRIQMSKISDVQVSFNGLDGLSDDLKTSITTEVRGKIKNILNSKVINILLRLMTRILDKNTDDNILSSFNSLVSWIFSNIDKKNWSF